MLEHQKKVLLGVANIPNLFRKELVKSFRWLSDQELNELHQWVKKEFGTYYSHLIGELFYDIYA